MFIVFLLLYAVWAWAAGALVKRVSRAVIEGNSFWVNEISLVLNFGALFGFIYTLSGYFDWRLVIAFIGAGQIGIVLSAILGGLVGSTSTLWGPRSSWDSGEFVMKHEGLSATIVLLTALLGFAYPILVGISYFQLSASALPERVFQYTLSMFFLGGLPLLWLSLISTLVSENIDADTRKRVFINQLSALVPNALWLALLFWSFGIAGAGSKVNVGTIALEFSPLLLGLVIGFFVLTVLIPYAIGGHRSNQWRSYLIQEHRSWMASMKDILETPAGSTYLPKLAALQQELDEKKSAFVASDPMIVAGIQIDQGIIPPNTKAFAPAYVLARELDPRFSHLDAMTRMSEKISEIQADLQKLTTDAELEKSAKEWIKYFQPREGALVKELAQAAKTRPPMVLLFSGIFLPIFSVVLGEFAKWLWTYFAKSLPH